MQTIVRKVDDEASVEDFDDGEISISDSETSETEDESVP